jgi:hypothetical protein
MSSSMVFVEPFGKHSSKSTTFWPIQTHEASGFPSDCLKEPENRKQNGGTLTP